MKHRGCDADDIALVDRFFHHHRMSRDRTIAVADQYSLGAAGGAARIGHAERVILVNSRRRVPQPAKPRKTG